MSTIWNPSLMQQYGGVVQYDGWDAKPSYQCGSCHSGTIASAAPSPMILMSMPPKIEPPPGTECCTCHAVIRPAHGAPQIP